MTEQDLDGTQIARCLVNNGSFGASERVRSIFLRLKADASDPFVNQASILPRAHVAGIIVAAWKDVVVGCSAAAFQPCSHRLPGGLHQFKLNGVFVKSKDAKALAQWYREVLGLDVKSWGGAALAFDTPGHPPKVSWTAFPEAGDDMSPSTREFMINFAIDDMDAMVARLAAHGVPILKRDDSDPFGRFAWIQDPDGTKIELWQPKKN